MTEPLQDAAESQPGAQDQPSGDRASGRLPEGWQSAAAAFFGVVLLGRGLSRRSLRGALSAVAGGALLYVAFGGDSRIEQTLESLTVGDELPDEEAETESETSITRSVTIGRPPDELYDAWRDPEQFTRVMGHVADVTSRNDDRFYWTVHGPMGRDVSWETHVVEEEPGEFVRWETPEDAMLPNQGEARFESAAGDRGTIVTLSITIDPPGGTLGNAALKRLGVVPGMLAGEALRRFKSLVETGEIQTLSGNPSARGRGDRV